MSAPEPSDAAPPTGDVTILLAAAARGDGDARRRLYDIAYAELRSRAAAMMARQPSGHTLQPTALVHEAFLRLAGGAARFADSVHFFSAASCAMRSILVDHARARAALKRGGAAFRVTLDPGAPGEDADAESVIAVHDALSRLESDHPDLARVVEMRYFGGLEFSEISAALAVPERTVYRRWERARVWLRRELGS